MKYLLIAGEASGDEHGARLIASLKAVDAKAALAFIGGDKMAQQAGVAPLYHYHKIAVMGLSLIHIWLERRSERTSCLARS